MQLAFFSWLSLQRPAHDLLCKDVFCPAGTKPILLHGKLFQPRCKTQHSPLLKFMNFLSAWPFSCPLSLNPLPHRAMGPVSLGCHCFQPTHKRQLCFFYSSRSNWASAFLTSPLHAWAMPLSEVTRKAIPNSTFSVPSSFSYLQSRFCSSSLWVSCNTCVASFCILG